MTVEKKDVIIHEIGTVGKITITEEMKNQIDHLHTVVGKTEWSGILVYRFLKGSIETMRDLEFKAENLFLMDIGSSAHTGFEYTAEDVVDMYDTIPNAMEQEIGLIHTHHSMGAYHSGTDMDELKDNTDKYNYYISLVVDFIQTYKCKIGFPSQTTEILESVVKNTQGKFVKVKMRKKREAILLGDLIVELPKSLKPSQWALDRYDSVIAKQEAAKKAVEAKRTSNYLGKSMMERDDVAQYYQSMYEKMYGKEGSFIDNILTAQDELNRKRESLMEQFTISLLTMDLESSIESIPIAVELFVDMDEESFEMYLDTIEPQIEIIHDSIFGMDQIYLLNVHLDRTVQALDGFKNEERIGKVINLFEQYELTVS